MHFDLKIDLSVLGPGTNLINRRGRWTPNQIFINHKTSGWTTSLRLSYLSRLVDWFKDSDKKHDAEKNVRDKNKGENKNNNKKKTKLIKNKTRRAKVCEKNYLTLWRICHKEHYST